MKQALPPSAKVAKDAKESIQTCVSEFIAFITSEASDKCLSEKRKTINGDDLLYAMTTLGFASYVSPLQIFLDKYKASVKGEKPEKIEKSKYVKKEKPLKIPKARKYTPSSSLPSYTCGINSSGTLTQQPPEAEPCYENAPLYQSQSVHYQTLLPPLPALPGAKCTVPTQKNQEDFYSDRSNTLNIEGIEYGVPGYRINYKENIPFNDPSLSILGKYSSYLEVPGVMNGNQSSDVNSSDDGGNHHGDNMHVLPPSGSKIKIENSLAGKIVPANIIGSSSVTGENRDCTQDPLDGIAMNRSVKKRRVQIN